MHATGLVGLACGPTACMNHQWVKCELVILSSQSVTHWLKPPMTPPWRQLTTSAYYREYRNYTTVKSSTYNSCICPGNTKVPRHLQPSWWRRLTGAYQGCPNPLFDAEWSSLRCQYLTHWSRVTHICVSNLTIIGSDNDLSPGRCQAIIWTYAGILSIEPLGTNLGNMRSMYFHSGKCIWKYRLRNVSHFVSASMS